MTFGAAVELYYQSRSGCPLHGTVILSSGEKLPKFGIDAETFKQYVNTIKNSDKRLNEDLFRYTTKHFHRAIDEVLGKSDPGSSLFEKAIQMKYNTARFAAYKTAHQVHDIKKSNNPQAINDKYNNNWLKTEYIHTIRSARAAKKWEQFQNDKDIYPYLEYLPSTAAEPRNEHRKLYGVIKEIDDPFWDIWMPPNDWGCKCRVRQVAKPDKFIEPPTDIKQPPAIMQNNPGKTGKAFTDGHPMIKQVSQTAKAEIEREFKTLYRRIIESAFISIFKNKKIKTNDGLVVTLSSVSFRKISSNDDYFHTIKHILVKKNIEFLKKAKLIRVEKAIKARRNIEKVLIYQDNDFTYHIWKTKGRDEYILHSIKKR